MLSLGDRRNTAPIQVADRQASLNYDPAALAFIRTGESLISHISSSATVRPPSKMWQRVPQTRIIVSDVEIDRESGFHCAADLVPHDFITGLVQANRGHKQVSRVDG